MHRAHARLHIYIYLLYVDTHIKRETRWMYMPKRENHAHSDGVFHPLFLPRLSRAWLFRQARSCTSRVKTVPNAARSSGKTSFQPLPVFPTATAAFNGFHRWPTSFFFFFSIFFLPFLSPLPNRIFTGRRGNFADLLSRLFNSAVFLFALLFFATQLHSFVIEKMWDNRLTRIDLNFLLIDFVTR